MASIFTAVSSLRGAKRSDAAIQGENQLESDPNYFYPSLRAQRGNPCLAWPAYGLPRRCAPRNDDLPGKSDAMNFGKISNWNLTPIISTRHCERSAAIHALGWPAYGLPRRFAPRNDDVSGKIDVMNFGKIINRNLTPIIS